MRKKPFLKRRHKDFRLKFAQASHVAPSSAWNCILWSDESKFNICGSDGRAKVWRKPGQELQEDCVQKTVKHGGGSVMVWGAMGAGGVGELVFIDGIMNATMYRSILENNLDRSAARVGLSAGWIFQHDNDPKHTARCVKSFLAESGREVMPWPAQSPDLNPIEHLWEELGRRMSKHEVRTKDELKARLIEEWNLIEPNVCQNLVASMPRRLAAVIVAKGGNTKY
jgi:transposase